MATNLEVAKSVYEAFGRGDIPAILEHLAEDVQWEAWESNWGQKAGVPWLTPRTGRSGVAEFFKVIGQFHFTHFSVKSLLAGERQVAATVELEAGTPGGGVLRDEEIHLWDFDGRGKVVRFRHYADTAKHIAAARGENTLAAARA